MTPRRAAHAGRVRRPADLPLDTHGRRGFFYEAWANGGADWKRIEVPAAQIARIKPEFLEEERRQTSESWFRQEYGCSFEALEGLVYPDFARRVVPRLPVHLGGDGSVVLRRTPYSDRLHLTGTGKKLGGLDFGFRNPFAAVWGIEDGDGVLWLTGEHYELCKPLSHHAQFLPHDVMWYADPSGAQERAELRCADFKVREGINALSLGIMAVATRLEQGTLCVLAGRCPNLLYEAGLYRYSDEPHAAGREAPLDEQNHALAALRYLIASLDKRHLAKRPRSAPMPESGANSTAPAKTPEEKELAEQDRLRRAQREYLLGKARTGPTWHESPGESACLPPRRGTTDQPRATPWEKRCHHRPPALKGHNKAGCRAIVATHHLSRAGERWRSGVILRQDSNAALVRGDVAGTPPLVRIAINGPEPTRRDLLAVIRNDFAKINGSIPGLEVKERVPVPGYEVEPLNYDDLIAAEAAGEKDWPIVVNGRFIKIPLATLLDGIEPKPKRQARKSATAAGHTIVNIDKSIHVGGDVTASQLAQTLQDSSNETG